MARSRLIKPGFFRNETLCELPHATRILYAGLWGIADREGRLEDRPKRIAADVFPYEPLDVDAMLDELAAAGFIVRYVVAGARYIAIPTFLDHQYPHLREAPSTLPAPDVHSASTVLALDQASPRSPVSVSVSKTVPKSESGSVSVAGSVSKSAAVTRASRVKPAGDGRLKDLAREVLREHPNEPQDVLIDTLQWTAIQRFKIKIKRREAIDYLQAGS